MSNFKEVHAQISPLMKLSEIVSLNDYLPFLSLSLASVPVAGSAVALFDGE